VKRARTEKHSTRILLMRTVPMEKLDFPYLMRLVITSECMWILQQQTARIRQNTAGRKSKAQMVHRESRASREQTEKRRICMSHTPIAQTGRQDFLFRIRQEKRTLACTQIIPRLIPRNQRSTNGRRFRGRRERRVCREYREKKESRAFPGKTERTVQQRTSTSNTLQYLTRQQAR